MYDGENIAAEILGGDTTVYLRDNTGIVSRTRGNAKEYFVSNYRGDTTAVVNANSDILKSYEYDAFGSLKNASAADDNPFRYCGEYFDDETGFVYLRNRYYDTKTRRFIQEDPARDELNWYAYCENNPVKYIDPWGLDAIVITTGTLTVAANAHTSVIVQDVYDNWYYFYWGNKNAVLLEVSSDKLGDLDTFNSWLTDNGAGEFGKKTDKPLHDTGNRYTTGTYIEGDFSESVNYFLEMATNAEISEKIVNKTHKYKNKSYSLVNNCMTVSFEGLKRGILPNGTKFSEFAKFDNVGSVRPNDFRVMIRETFANQDFTKAVARKVAIENIGTKKPWYMSNNYYKRGQQYGKMLKEN